MNPIREMRALVAEVRSEQGCSFRFLTNDRRRFGELVDMAGARTAGKHADDPDVRRSRRLAGVIVADDPLEGMPSGSLVVELDDGRTYPMRGWNRHAALHAPPRPVTSIRDPHGLVDGMVVDWTDARGVARRGVVHAEPEGWIVVGERRRVGVLEYTNGRWLVAVSFDATGALADLLPGLDLR